MKTWRIALIDDHPTFREGLRCRLEIEPDLEVCAEADDLPSALRAVEGSRPDLAIVDVNLGSDSGIDLVRRLCSRDDPPRILVLSMYEEELYADRALKAGARGYVTKNVSSEIILQAVRRVLDGGIYLAPGFSEQLVHRLVLGRAGLSDDPVGALSDRELQVFQLIGRGLTTSEIAAQLHLSVHTIERTASGSSRSSTSPPPPNSPVRRPSGCSNTADPLAGRIASLGSATVRVSSQSIPHRRRSLCHVHSNPCQTQQAEWGPRLVLVDAADSTPRVPRGRSRETTRAGAPPPSNCSGGALREMPVPRPA